MTLNACCQAFSSVAVTTCLNNLFLSVAVGIRIPNIPDVNAVADML